MNMARPAEPSTNNEREHQEKSSENATEVPVTAQPRADDAADSSPITIISSPPEFNPGWRFHLSFTSLCIISLAAALDATSLSVALPVRDTASFPPILVYLVSSNPLSKHYQFVHGDHSSSTRPRSPKSHEPPFFEADTNPRHLDHLPGPPRQRHRGLLGGDLIPTLVDRLPTHPSLPLRPPRPQTRPPLHPCSLHYRRPRRRHRTVDENPADRTNHPGHRRRRHHLPD